MNTEIEATFLETDHTQLRSKLVKLGAKCTAPEQLMRRAIYDYPDLRLDSKAAWIRVRDEGGRITMCYKQRQSETVSGMKEVEFEVSSFESARSFLEEIGLETKAEQESKREVWEYDNCEIMLDTWPWIPAFTEVEGPSEESVRKVAAKLGLEWDQAVFDSIDAVYMKYYDVTRTEISSTSITFGKVPTDLEAKRLKVN